MNSISPSSHRRAQRILAVACVTVVLALTGAAIANALPGRSADSRQVSFAGTSFAAASNENVDVAGNLHVVTSLSGSDATGWRLDWHTNLDNLTGVGQTTGEQYRGTGADNGTVVYPPGPPVRETFFEAGFTLRPPGGSIHTPSPIRLAMNVVYGENGQVSTIDVRVADAPIGTVD